MNTDYEKCIKEKHSFQTGAHFITRKIDGVRYTGFGVQAWYSWRLTQNDRPEDLFVGPTAAFSFVGYNDDFYEESDNYTYFAVTIVTNNFKLRTT